MYAFQFEDGTYRIDIETSSKLKHAQIYKNVETTRLFEQPYVTRAAAYDAIGRIKALLAAL